MPVTTGFETPSWATIVARTAADFRTRTGEDPGIPRSWQWGLVRVTAGVSYAIHALAAFIARQVIADRADDAGVIRGAKVFGVRQQAAVKASGNAVFAALAGTSIPEGTVMQRTDGVQYETTADASEAAGTIIAPIEAVVAGSAGNATTATSVILLSPIDGVDSNGAIQAPGITNGVDQEEVEGLRDRWVDRLRNPPHGGAAHDYRAWARAALEAVDAVWVIKGSVVGVAPTPTAVPLTVYFTVEGEGAAVIPTGAQVTTVQAELDDRAPIGADPTATAPAAVALTLTINDGAGYTASDRAAVEDDLHALCAAINRRRQKDVRNPPYAVGSARLYNSEIRNTIGQTMEVFTLDSVQGDGTGLSNVTLTAGQAIHLGVVTWV